MRSIIVFLLLTMACSSEPSSVEYTSIKQEYNGNPPPPIICESPKIVCGISCVDISRDNLNCGDCDATCDVAQGEFCLNHYCRDVRNYGFYFGPVGPVEYDVRRDLPRPPRIREEDR